MPSQGRFRAARGPARSNRNFSNDANTGPEYKFVDVTAVNQTFQNSAAPFVALLNSVAEGTDNQNRIGRKLTLKNLNLRLSVQNDSTSLSSANFAKQADTVRWAVVFDKQANGSAASVNNVWNAPGTAVDPFAGRLLDYLDRFSILAEGQEVLNVSGANAFTVHKYIKMNLPTRYIGTGTGVANIESGALYVMVWDQNTSGATQSTVSFTSHLLFEDL